MHGKNPDKIECNNIKRPIKYDRAGSNFVEGLRTLYIIIMDVSIIKVQIQNVDNMREEVDYEFK